MAKHWDESTQYTDLAEHERFWEQRVQEQKEEEEEERLRAKELQRQQQYLEQQRANLLEHQQRFIAQQTAFIDMVIRWAERQDGYSSEER